MKMIAGRGNRCVADITKRTKRYNAMWREKRYLRRVLTANYVQDACINLSRATFKIWNLWKIETIGVFLEKLGESFWQMRRKRNLKRLQLVEIAKERANATFFNFFLWHRNEDLNNTFQRVAQTAFSIKCSPYINVAHVLFKFSLESQVKTRPLILSSPFRSIASFWNNFFIRHSWQTKPLNLSSETKSFDPIFKKFRKTLPPVWKSPDLHYGNDRAIFSPFFFAFSLLFAW